MNPFSTGSVPQWLERAAPAECILIHAIMQSLVPYQNPEIARKQDCDPRLILLLGLTPPVGKSGSKMGLDWHIPWFETGHSVKGFPEPPWKIYTDMTVMGRNT
jgi:hypothetical protein